MSKSNIKELNIKELTKSPFKGTNTDKYDKYFDKLKSVFDKFKNEPLGELEENLFAELEKLKIKTKDPIELHIYGTILDSNQFYGYAEMFLDKAYDLGYNVFENKMTELTGDDITILWIGLPVEKGTIGRFIVAPEVREQLEIDFKDDISIDFYDENVPTHELSTYQDIIDAMKATEFGGILFTEAWDLPKDIAIDLLPKIKNQKEENGSFTVKDLENIMLTNGASLKLLDDTISELVNMDFDFDTEDEDDNDYTIQENSREATGLEKEVFLYLNDLRSSGVTNMYGAVPYIMDEYPEINKQEAIKLLTTWMKNFNEEGNYGIINEGLDKSRVKEMRQELKKEFPNIKFSITSDYNSITVSIMQSDIDFLKNATREGGHYQVNHYHIRRDFENQPEAKEVLQRIYEIISADRYIVSEDGDYGSIPNYYTNIQVGKWDRPFVFTGQPEEVNEGFGNRAVAADIGPVLINKLKDYLIINNIDKQFDISHLLYLLGDLPFDLNTYEVETDSDSIIQLSKIFTKNINELANELSIVISDNKNLFEYEESKITESLSTKQDKIDYILFYHNRDRSELENMSDAVIDKVYKTTLKEVTGEIEEETFGVDTDNLPEIGDGVTNTETNNTIEGEELTGIMSEEEFLNKAEEFNESAFGVVTQKGFKVKNIHPDVSEKKFITDDINEAYKQYKSFMNLYSFNEDSINKEVLSKDDFIEGLTEYELEGGFGSTIETGFELYYVPENTLGYKKKFKTNSKEEAYKQYLSFMKTNEDDTVQPMTDQINPEKRTKLRSVTVKYADGTVINTSMAAHLTDEDIRNYFQIGTLFNVGSYPNDNLQPVEEVIINENDAVSDTVNDAVNENHKQVMPYQDESMKPWIIYPDSVEAPKEEDFDIVAIKNLISSDNFLRFAYENLMTGEFYEDMQTMYDTYIKNDEVNLEKMKTFESYAKYTIEETLKKSAVASLILENMTSEITDEVKRQIYINLNELNEIHNSIKQNIAISTPQYSYDLNEAFKGNIKNTLKVFRDNKIALKSFNEGNVLNYNNNSINALGTTLKHVSELFTTNSLELNSELSVVTSLALLQTI